LKLTDYRDPPPEPKEDGSLYLAHHPSFSSLLASAKAGCEFCLAIDAELVTVSGRIDRILLSEGEGVDTRVRIAIGQAAFLGNDHIYTVVCVGTFQFGSPENTPKGYLLLDPVHEAGEGVFERVGIAPHVSWNFLDNFDPKDWKQMEISII